MKYILNCHFTNQDVQFTDFQSLQRTFLFSTNDEIEKVIDFINSRDSTKLCKVQDGFFTLDFATLLKALKEFDKKLVEHCI